MFLARKFSNSKWFGKTGTPFNPVTADAVTCDLRTQDNKLSFWKCKTADKRDLREVVLALSSNYHRLDKCNIVLIDIDEFRNLGLNLDLSPGNSRVQDLADTHVDVCKLSYAKLGGIASLISQSLQLCRFDQFERKDVCDILADAVSANRVNVDSFDTKLRSAVQGCLDQRAANRQ